MKINSEMVIKVGKKGGESFVLVVSKSHKCVCYRQASVGLRGGFLSALTLLSNQTRFITTSPSTSDVPQSAALCTLIRRRQWQPTPILLPGKPHGQRSLVGCSPWGR